MGGGLIGDRRWERGGEHHDEGGRGGIGIPYAHPPHT